MASGQGADTPRTRLWIGNEWTDACAGNTFETLNPATGEVIADVAEAHAEDIDAAVSAARSAFADTRWRRMNPHKRSRLLWRLADLVDRNADELGLLETRDNGKPYFEARRIDVPSVAQTLRYYAGMADKVQGDTVPVPGPFLNYTLREPVGVVGAIIPWNFPLSMAAWKVAPALACGNTVVLKPAEETPLTALRFGELAAEAGFPPGVLNVVPGFGETAGAALVRHPGVNAISFTGSTEVGKTIMRESAETLKKVSLELGGKSPNIVFADADLGQAVKGASTGIFYGKGEVCAAGSRILVEAAVHDRFVEALAARAAKATVGDPMAPTTRLGAIVSEAQLDRVMGYIEAGKRDGATLVAGGDRVIGERPRQLRERHRLPRCGSGHGHCPGRDLRPGGCRDPLRGRGRRDRQGQRFAVRARGRSVDARHRQGPPHGRRDRRGDGLGQHLQPVFARVSLRGLQGERLRQGSGLSVRTREVHPPEERLGGPGRMRNQRHA